MSRTVKFAATGVGVVLAYRVFKLYQFSQDPTNTLMPGAKSFNADSVLRTLNPLSGFVQPLMGAAAGVVAGVLWGNRLLGLNL